VIDLTLYIADDHAIMVEGLLEILKSKPQWKVLGTARDGLEITILMNNRPADIVILDINMPKMNGIQCARWIKENYPKTKVIILTMFPEKSYLHEIIKAGVDGCLLKSRGSLELISAIERVSQNKSYFDMVKDFDHPEKSHTVNLSEREVEIVKLIVNGFTSNEIADQLFLSEHTVKTHRKNIFRKIGINNTSQLASYAINHKIIP